MDAIESYYNKFNEEKRLLSRHGQVEYYVTFKYINKYLDLLKEEGRTNISIIDIGAGTGRYSVALSELEYDVTAVEYVKYNLGILKQKKANVKAFQGNAVNLKRFKDNSFDMALLFGPMYHLINDEDKLKALNEAKRVVRPGGIILVAYCMNDYSIVRYGFKENNILDLVKSGKVTSDYRVKPTEDDLYDYVRLEDINRLNSQAGLERLQIIAPDGPADYIRQVLNAMDDETFKIFMDYQLANCERPELLGASSHTVDILRNTK